MSNQLEQLVQYEDTAAMIAEKIGSYYHILQERKDLHKIIREVTEEKLLDFYIEQHFEEDVEELQELLETGQIAEKEAQESYEKLREKALFSIDTFYKFEDVLLGYKNRANKVWVESFNDVLAEKKLLPFAKTVLKKDEHRYNIASFRLPNDKYLKIYDSLTSSKEEKEEAKDSLKAQKKQLQLKSIDELILLFKSNKETLKSLEKIYEKDRAELFLLMTKEGLTEVDANDEGTMNFKMHERSGGYDTAKIAKGTVEKKCLFFYAVRSDGTIECKDWFTGETFSFNVDITHDGHRISFKGDVFYVDGQALEQPDIADVSLLKKKDYKEIEKLEWKVAYGSLQMSGLDYLKQCKTSTTLVEELIDQAKLHPNVLEQYRLLDGKKDGTLVFEMIEEDADNNRKFFFVQKRRKRMARFERLQRLQA